jgi:hypothetical protein
LDTRPCLLAGSEFALLLPRNIQFVSTLKSASAEEARGCGRSAVQMTAALVATGKFFGTFLQAPLRGSAQSARAIAKSIGADDGVKNNDRPLMPALRVASQFGGHPIGAL